MVELRLNCLSGLRDACHSSKMLTLGDVDRLAYKAVQAVLRKTTVNKIYSAQTMDSDGHDALDVTIVLGPDYNTTITGDKALNAILRIQRDLRASGKKRLAIVNFTTEDELIPHGDT